MRTEEKPGFGLWCVLLCGEGGVEWEVGVCGGVISSSGVVGVGFLGVGGVYGGLGCFGLCGLVVIVRWWCGIVCGMWW